MLCYSTEFLWFDDNQLDGTLPTEIGELTKLSECYRDWYNNVHILILIILFDWWRSFSISREQ
jgi:hypothetical protein